uniref:Uncharacterized protein n=1 Tax=Anas platyrhynchos platyrhynchos TaxID=8840 RepID=A0A493U2N8_ANAPP
GEWDEAVQEICFCSLPHRLDDCNLSSSNCKDLSSVINTNPSLTELKLNNNELGDAGIDLVCGCWGLTVS